MDKRSVLRIVPVAAFLFITIFAMASIVPAEAAWSLPAESGGPAYQVTPEIPDPEVTVVIPDTGQDGDTNIRLDNTFLLLLVLGVLVLVLIVALAARGSSHTHIDHE